MSKLSFSLPNHEWAVMELHPEKGLVWLTSIPCRKGKKVSVFGKVAPMRKTRGRHNLCIFFVQFEKRPNARREFFEDFNRQMERSWQRPSLRFHYDELDSGSGETIKVSDIVTIRVQSIVAPQPSSMSGKILTAPMEREA